MAGYRKVLPRNEALERLMEERDDLKIQIHLVAEKLDAATLARQTRAFARTVSGRERAHALRALARVYEQQADDVEPRELA